LKYFLLSLLLLITSCASTTSEPRQVELTGKLMGSYVSTPQGMFKSSILYISNPTQIKVVSSLSSGNAQQVLLVNPNKDFFNEHFGEEVTVKGLLKAEHVDAFHTDFTLEVSELTVQ